MKLTKIFAAAIPLFLVIACNCAELLHGATVRAAGPYAAKPGGIVISGQPAPHDRRQAVPQWAVPKQLNACDHLATLSAEPVGRRYEVEPTCS